MRRLSAFVLHATAAGIMTWGWFQLLKVAVGNKLVAQKGGHLKFLTNQGLAIAWSCMVVSLFCDVFPSVAAARRAKKVLLMISMPLAFVVSSIYWTLLFFLPHLIMTSSDMIHASGAVSRPMGLPLTTDLALHASPLLTLLIDFFFFEPKFPRAYVRKAAPVAIVIFSFWYASFVEYCAMFSGSFPYPFLTHSSFPVRVLIYVTTAGIGLGCLRTLNALHP